MLGDSHLAAAIAVDQRTCNKQPLKVTPVRRLYFYVVSTLKGSMLVTEARTAVFFFSSSLPFLSLPLSPFS